MNKNAAIGLLIFVVLMGAATLYDYVRSKSITIELAGLEPQTVYADPNSPVSIKLNVKKHGLPVAGHDITGLVIGKGNLRADKIATDAEGTVTFIYYPYSYMQGVQDEGEIELEFRDVSDSVIVAIQQPETISLMINKPDKVTESKFNMNDMFGE